VTDLAHTGREVVAAKRRIVRVLGVNWKGRCHIAVKTRGCFLVDVQQLSFGRSYCLVPPRAFQQSDSEKNNAQTQNFFLMATSHGRKLQNKKKAGMLGLCDLAARPSP